MVNKVILVGFVGKALEVRHTPGGQAVTNIRLATSRNWTDKQSGQRKEETEWHDVEVWGNQAKACGEHLDKGSRIYVEGRIKTERWEHEGQKRSRVKIVADSVRFLGQGNGNGAEQPTDEGDEPRDAA